MPACEHARPDAVSRWALRHPRLLTTGIPLAVFAVISWLPIWPAWTSTPSTGLVAHDAHFWKATRAVVELNEWNGWSDTTCKFKSPTMLLLQATAIIAIPLLCCHAQLYYARQMVRYGNLRRRRHSAASDRPTFSPRSSRITG
jgi:hypothetical protein